MAVIIYMLKYVRFNLINFIFVSVTTFVKTKSIKLIADLIPITQLNIILNHPSILIGIIFKTKNRL